MTQDFSKNTRALIDNLKGVCASYGLGNDGNEFKIITQAFLYKFMNDKLGYELKQIEPKLKTSDNWEVELNKLTENEYEFILMRLNPSSARLKREHFLSALHNRQNEDEFAKIFDDTLREISVLNNDIFSVKTETGAKIKLFDEVSQYITDVSKRDNFARAIINQLVFFSFEDIFVQKFDFFSTIFEYLIKDYNKDGGGKYAEYYTPHAVSKIIASILVNDEVNNVTCYDPAAGSGTLLMNIAHAIGEDKCTIYSQDISQKSSSLLRLNLILNNLVHSIHNIIQGNTIKDPYFRINNELLKFNYIVSNPPFKLDFSDFRNDVDTKSNSERFFAGIPSIPDKDKDKMPIYLLFLQHIIHSLAEKGKAAIVVPTGFLTAQGGIEKKIRQKLIDEKILRGIVSMPSNIFATTTASVSILFIDKEKKYEDVLLMDASSYGTKVKDGKNQKTILSTKEEETIINTFNNNEVFDNLAVRVKYEYIRENKYSLSTGQYFETKTEAITLDPNEFNILLENYNSQLDNLFLIKRVVENLALSIFHYWFIQYDFPDKNGKPYRTNGGSMIWNEKLKKNIPEEWMVERLGNIFETSLGGTPDTKRKDYWENGTIPWISSGETDNFPITNTNAFITQAGLDHSPAVLLPKGSIIVSIVRYIRVSILGIDASTNQSVVGIKETNEYKTNFLYPFLKSQIPVLMSKRTGAQQPHINKGEIDNIYFIIPNTDVLSKYYEITNSLYESITNYEIKYSDIKNIQNNLIPNLSKSL